MNYRKDKYGNDLSVLGYGCMRFPQKMGKRTVKRGSLLQPKSDVE